MIYTIKALFELVNMHTQPYLKRWEAKAEMVTML